MQIPAKMSKERRRHQCHDDQADESAASDHFQPAPHFPPEHHFEPVPYFPPPQFHHEPYIPPPEPYYPPPPPPQHCEPPPQHHHSPQHYEPPPQHHEPPPQHYHPPPQHHEPPPQHYHHPPQHHEPPPQHYHPPPQHHEPPPQHYHPPPQHHEPPPQHYHPPPQHHEPPPPPPSPDTPQHGWPAETGQAHSDHQEEYYHVVAEVENPEAFANNSECWDSVEHSPECPSQMVCSNTTEVTMQSNSLMRQTMPLYSLEAVTFEQGDALANVLADIHITVEEKELDPEDLDLRHRQAWESGEIDYRGRDKFEFILGRIQECIGSVLRDPTDVPVFLF